MSRKLVTFDSIISVSQDIVDSNVFHFVGTVPAGDIKIAARNVLSVGNHYYQPSSIERIGAIIAGACTVKVTATRL